MSYTFYHGFVNCPLTSGVAAAINDTSALTQIVLPDGTYVDSIYFDKGSFSSTGVLSIGWSDNTDGILPASAGISTDDLNTTGVSYVSAGKNLAMNGDTPLVLTSNSNVDSGQVNVIIKGIRYDDIP